MWWHELPLVSLIRQCTSPRRARASLPPPRSCSSRPSPPRARGGEGREEQDRGGGKDARARLGEVHWRMRETSGSSCHHIRVAQPARSRHKEINTRAGHYVYW